MIVGATYAENRKLQDSLDRALGKPTAQFKVLGYDDVRQVYWLQYPGEAPSTASLGSPVAETSVLVSTPDGVEPVSEHVKHGHRYDPKKYC